MTTDPGIYAATPCSVCGHRRDVHDPDDNWVCLDTFTRRGRVSECRCTGFVEPVRAPSGDRSADQAWRDLVALRVRRGITVGEMARRQGVSSSAVSTAEGRDFAPRWETMVRYAAMLDVEVAVVLRSSVRRKAVS